MKKITPISGMQKGKKRENEKEGALLRLIPYVRGMDKVDIRAKRVSNPHKYWKFQLDKNMSSQVKKCPFL